MALAHQHQQVTGWTGWVGVAGFLMVITGMFHLFYGIAGILGSDWYIYNSGNAYLFDSSAWGWSMLIGGALLILSAFLLFAGNMFGRIIGGILAAYALLVNIALFPVAPLWSTLAIVFDALILYAIIAHGKEMKTLNEDAE